MFEWKDYVYEVYKTRNFSQAARNLYISQPALSATVKKAELSIGSPIFDRSTNPVQMTECGTKYIEYIKHLNDMENEFSNYINDLNELRTGHLSIGGSNLFASYVLPPLLSGYMQKYPQIDISLTESNTHDLEHKLFDGDLDLVIDNYPFSDEIFSKEFYSMEHLLLAVPKAFIASGIGADKEITDIMLTAADIKKGRTTDTALQPSRLSAFTDFPFLILKRGNDTRTRFDEFAKDLPFTPKVILELDQQATSYYNACCGIGITFVSDTLIKRTASDSRVVFFRLPEKYSARNIYFYHKQSKYTTRAMSEFLKTLH